MDDVRGDFFFKVVSRSGNQIESEERVKYDRNVTHDEQQVEFRSWSYLG